jgi:hypothetical protein
MVTTKYRTSATERLDNPEFVAFLADNEYSDARQLADGTIAALHPLLYTTAICTNISWSGYSNRFCFKTRERALIELNGLDACDDVPTGWVARR